MSDTSTSFKERLRTDLTAAMRSRDKVRSGTIRMVLTALTEAEVAGSEARELTDREVLDVVVREAKKRREAREAFTAAGRSEQAEKEQAEADVLAEYLPRAMTPAEVSEIVRAAIEQSGGAELGMRAMGTVMGLVTPQTKGRADGGVVAAEVRRQLAR